MGDHSVLVLTRLDDPTSDTVIGELNARGVPVVRLDPADLLTGQATVAARYGSAGLSGTLTTATREVELTGIRSVYFRRPTPYEAPADMDDQDRRFALEQARHGFGGILAGLPCRYVNHPAAISAADRKPHGLRVATDLGFLVPETIVTNSLQQARAFALRHGPVVYKPLRITPFRGVDGHAVTIWVDIANPEELDEQIETTAHVFQTATAGKVADVRITVIGRRAFGVRIDTPHLDFRRDYTKTSYRVFDIPADIEDRCLAYLDRFRLLFGAFDFGLRADGQLEWYECGAAAQWHWLEAETGLPMTAALADLLEMTT